MAVTSGRTPLSYDEAAILDKLKALPRSHRVLFACACAERLVPAYRWYCQQFSVGDFEAIRAALDAAWSGAHAEAPLPPPGIGVWRQRVEALVPDEAESVSPGWAVAQNAVISVAYALRAAETGDAQESAWAARQLYEAADTVVQQAAPVQTYIEDVRAEAAVQLALSGIDGALRALAPVDIDSLVEAARSDGKAFLAFVISPAEAED